MTKKYIQSIEGIREFTDSLNTKYHNQDALGLYGICIEILEQQRTVKQNSALHVYFGLLAKALNDAGFSIKMEYFGKEIEIEWDAKKVKERMWLGVMEAETGKTRTSDLNRKEVSQVYETLTRWLTEKIGVFIPFPEERR